MEVKGHRGVSRRPREVDSSITKDLVKQVVKEKGLKGGVEAVTDGIWSQDSSHGGVAERS